ncbi:MAG: tetratricopeptide repeat protein [Spirosomataceae bacterium]
MKTVRLLISGVFVILLTLEATAQKFVDFYKAGAKLNQEQKWAQSIEYFDAALKVSNTDTKAIVSRTGRPSEYFPNRELGVAYFMQGKKAEAKRYLEKSFSDEPTERAVEFLRKIDPDWQDPRSLAEIPKPPKPLLEKERLEKSAESVEGGQSITLKIPVKNEGEGRFEKGILRLVPQSVGKGIEFEPTIAVGDVRAGSNRTAQVTIRTNSLLTDGKASFVLKLESESGTVWDEVPVSFKTQSPPVPMLRVVGLVASNDSKLILEKGRRAKAVKLLVKNEGRGTFNKPTVSLTFNDRPLTAGGAALTTILAGETVTIPCDLFVPSHFSAAAATVTINVQEPSGLYNLSEKVNVPVQEPLTPLLHFDKTAIAWEGTREGFITLLSQPTVKYTIVNESDEPVNELIVRMVQSPVNPGFSVPGSKKMAALESNKKVGDELKLGISPKLLKGNQAKFTLRLENTQGKLLDKIEVEAPILLPPKQAANLPTAEETHKLVDKIQELLDNQFSFNLRYMGDSLETNEAKSNYQQELVRTCFKKGDKVSISNDIVLPELVRSGKFPEAFEAETYLNNLSLWYGNYLVEFALDKARYSKIQFNEKGVPYLDVYVKKIFRGKSKSKEFPGVEVNQENLLQFKMVFDRYKLPNGKWDTKQVFIKGIEKVPGATELTAQTFTNEEWEGKEAAEKNNLMSLSSALNGLTENLKSKLPATAKRLFAEPLIGKNGKNTDDFAYKMQNQLISSLNLKKLKWVNAEEWDPLKAVPNEDFILEGGYEMQSSGVKLTLTLRNFRTYETVAQSEAQINSEWLDIAIK